ncbi:hypothetical protein Mycsm_01748 [Mycobacterium sp. JS623]|uniref:hypothetical protein n=1 Tax=Mycobacterium sp. JS623 TaxID=212767 RepID=UPI0002A59352|nr:hypothetical protein [Mycobacterium sp. JS623]AGB22141.1 hypothetical protein Mycsm_01748 [Mycobacterium sp. JS623]
MTTNDTTMSLQRAAVLDQVLLQQELMRANGNRGDGLGNRSATAAYEVNDYLSQITLGDPGTCGDKATTTFVVTDNSGSVCGPGGNDPTSQRHDEALLTIRHVAAACTCGRDRVALLPFDQPSLGLVLPQCLDGNGIRRLKRGMVIAERTGVSSSLLPALTFAERLAKLTPNHAAIVVLSDFELTDPYPNQELERLANFPGYVHVVVLGGFTPGQLEDDERVAISEITPESQPGEVAHAIFDGLTHYRQGVVAR